MISQAALMRRHRGRAILSLSLPQDANPSLVIIVIAEPYDINQDEALVGSHDAAKSHRG